MLKNEIDSSQVLNKHEFIRLLYSSTKITSALLDKVKALLHHQSTTNLTLKTPDFLSLLKETSPEIFASLPENLISLISMFDRLFDYIQTEKHLQSKMTNLIGHLRIHFFYLALTDITLLTDTNHPVRIFFNDLVKVGLLWSEEDPKTILIEEQISLTVSQILKADSSQKIDELVKHTASQFNRFAVGLIQKTDIFEKRIRESEEAKAKTLGARLWAKEKINSIVARNNTPHLIVSTFSEAWEHVLFLARIKDLEDDQKEAQFTIKQLIVSLRPILDATELDKFSELRPILLKKIYQGFDNTPLKYEQVEEFMARLNAHYDQTLQLAQEHLQQSVSEEIIRLKPSSQLDLSVSQEEADESQQVTLLIDEMSLDQWVNFSFNRISNSAQNLDLISTDNRHIELRMLEPGKWFELQLNGETKRGKFACYIKQNDKYLFVSGMGSKIADFDSDTLERAFKNKNIRSLENTNTFERAYERLASEVVESHLKQQKEKHRLSQEKAAAEQRELENKKIEDQLRENEQQKIAEQEAQLAAHKAQLEKHKNEQQIQNITLLPIGSWVEFEVGDDFLKCRLAAKIASTGKFIFVDRAGVKVKQCFEPELCELFDTGLLKLKLKNDVFDSALASAITSFRSAKPTNR